MGGKKKNLKNQLFHNSESLQQFEKLLFKTKWISVKNSELCDILTCPVPIILSQLHGSLEKIHLTTTVTAKTSRYWHQQNRLGLTKKTQDLSGSSLEKLHSLELSVSNLTQIQCIWPDSDSMCKNHDHQILCWKQSAATNHTTLRRSWAASRVRIMRGRLKARGKSGNEVSIWDAGKFQHIPGDLEGRLHAKGWTYAQTRWEGPTSPPWVTLRLLSEKSKG